MKIEKTLLLGLVVMELYEAYLRHGDLWRLIIGFIVVVLLLAYSIWIKTKNKK